MMVRRALAAPAVALAVLAVACQVLDDVHARVSSPLGQDAALISDASAGKDGSATGCVPDVPPPPAAQASAAALPPIVLAVQSIYFSSQNDAGIALGYNLDCVDTCPGPASCVSAGGKHCDGEGGIDVEANGLIEEVLAGLGAQGALDAQIASGGGTLLFRLSDWTGATDERVTFKGMISTGIIANAEAGTTTPPRWDGTDVWEVAPSSASYDAGVYAARAITTSAYVDNTINGYVVVGQLDSLQFIIGPGVLTLRDAYFVGTIQEIGFAEGLKSVGYRLDGQIVGRIPTANVLAVLPLFSDPKTGGRLCGDTPIAKELKLEVCAQADIMSNPLLDDMGAACDALSIAIGVTAISANLGYPYAGIPIVPGCDGSVSLCE